MHLNEIKEEINLDSNDYYNISILYYIINFDFIYIVFINS